MAGSPRKRARREAEAVSAQTQQFGLNREELDAIAAGKVPLLDLNPDGIPEAISATRDKTRAHNARARSAAAPAAPGFHLPRSPAPLRSGYAGPSVRNFADSTEAAQLANLALALPSAVSVRIERTRPQWAAGWLEDYQLETDSIGELLEYLRDEYGGQKYRIQAISAAGQPIYAAGIPIAGPPRAAGRVIDRDSWEHGSGSRAAAPAAVIAPAGRPDDNTGLVKLVLEEARQSRNATLDAVRELTDRSGKSVEALLKTIVNARETSAKTATLSEQLGSLQQNLDAARSVVEALTPAAAPAAAPAADDKSVLEKAAEGALVGMLTEAIKPGATRAAAGGPFPPGMMPGALGGFPPGAPGAPAAGPIPDARKVKPD